MGICALLRYYYLPNSSSFASDLNAFRPSGSDKTQMSQKVTHMELPSHKKVNPIQTVLPERHPQVVQARQHFQPERWKL